jgi:sterol desaturase/sphingolipid hydroxylase (fatty acid hydroxylase superfamily)
MDEFQALYAIARGWWHAWFPHPFVRGCATTLLFLGVIYTIVLVLETVYRTRTRNYRSRQFAYDAAYYFYYRSGLHRMLFTVAILGALSAPFAYIGVGLLRGQPMWLQVVLGLVISDFVMYWLHRAQHRIRFLWAFHTTHHAPSQLTFATFLRFHPIEVALGDVVSYGVLALLGTEFTGLVAVYLVTTFLGEVQHTQIPWRMGPLRWIFVTPRFHAFHHSAERAQHDTNYGGLFSFWDYLFGTATRDDAPAPVALGLHDVKADSLMGTVVSPFVLLWRWYGPRRAEAAASVAAEPDAPEAPARPAG